MRLLKIALVGGLTITALWAQTQSEMQALAKAGYGALNQGDLKSAYEKFDKAAQIADQLNLTEALGALGKFFVTLGDQHSNLNQRQEALTNYQKARDIFLKLDEKVKQGLVYASGNPQAYCNQVMSRISSIYIQNAEYAKGREIAHQALQIAQSNNDNEGVADAAGNLGIAYKALGDYKQAGFYYDMSLQADKMRHDTSGIITNNINIGNLDMTQGFYWSATTHYEEALYLGRQIGDSSSVAAALSALSGAYQASGEYQGALRIAEQSLKLLEDSNDRAQIAHNYLNLGAIYSHLGNYMKTLAYFKEALRMFEEQGHKSTAGTALTSLGNVYKELGDFQQALNCYESANRIFTETGQNQLIAQCYEEIARVYYGLGEYEQTLTWCIKSLRLFRELGQDTRAIRGFMADVYADMGDYDRAESEYNIVYAGGTNLSTTRVLVLKAQYDSALVVYEKFLPEALQGRDVTVLFPIYCGMGHAYFGQGNFQKARQSYEKAIELTENLRRALSTEERSKYFAARVGGFYRTVPYEGLIRTLIKLGLNEEAFYYSENIKARVLAEAVARGQADLNQTLAPEFVKGEEALNTRIRRLNSELEVLYKAGQMTEYAEKEKEFQEALRLQNAFVTRLRAKHPEYAAVNYPVPIRPTEVKLRPDELLAEFEITKNTLIVFLLNGADKKLTVRTIDITREELQAKVRLFRSYFDDIASYADLGKFKPEIGQELFSLLFGNVLDNLSPKTTLVLVPDEILGLVPFDALVAQYPGEEKLGESNYGPFPLGVEYLADRLLTVYAQSATSLTLARTLTRNQAQGQLALAVCDPIFSKNDPRLRQKQVETDPVSAMVAAAMADWKKMGVAGTRQKGTPDAQTRDEEIFPRLEKTSQLAKNLQALFGDQTTVLTGAEANEARLTQLPFEKYKYIAFGTHGLLDNSVAYIRQPALVLNQVENQADCDGFLTMSEVMSRAVPAEVVALTACETGVGKSVSGEGVMGMGRAFQFAGCRNVLMSLWSVAEDATVALSNSFFQSLKQANAPQQALRSARQSIRKKGYEHPFYWAAFILVGD